jgi:hypothetical protein
MRTYSLDAGTTIRFFFGLELIAGLRMFDETKPLADPFEVINNKLDQTHTARQAARKPMVEARAGRRLAVYAARQAIRAAASAAEIADGGRRGPIFYAVFPEGIQSYGKQKGGTLLAPMKGLIDRFSKSQLSAIDTYRQEWLPKLTAKHVALDEAGKVFGGALTAYNDIFEVELALRNQHRLEVDRIQGQVRAAFPGDKEKQDLVFPEVEAKPSKTQPATAKAKAPKTNTPAPANKETPPEPPSATPKTDQ